MSQIDDVYSWNQRHAGTARQARSPFPRRKLAVVSCMDTRIRPSEVLGVQAGDIHVIRNAGGLVTDDVIRSLMLSQVALGTLEVMVIGHTGCGLEGLQDRDLRTAVERERGRRPLFPIGGFLAVEEQVRESVRMLRRNPYLDGEVRGFVLDVEDGTLAEIQV